MIRRRMSFADNVTFARCNGSDNPPSLKDVRTISFPFSEALALNRKTFVCVKVGTDKNTFSEKLARQEQCGSVGTFALSVPRGQVRYCEVGSFIGLGEVHGWSRNFKYIGVS